MARLGREKRAAGHFFLLAFFLAALGLAPAAAQDRAPQLAAYNADINESSISGISSGAFMAVQFGVSWSSIVKGVGVIAGGPYYCAQGTATDGLLGNFSADLTATGPCMKGPPPALAPLFGQTKEWARRGDIDDTRNIARQRIYIFAGYNDAVVNPDVGEAAYRFYRRYLPDEGNLFYQNTIGAGHSQVTVGYGLACADNKEYFIDKCNYDQAGIVLQHIYGALEPKNNGELSGKLLPFDQRAFTFPESPGSYSMAETGYVYVPASCAARQPCRIHIALHGCKQNFDTIGDRYTRHAGYNEWADTNQLVILYPQTIVGNPLLDFGTPLNPFGCWDWWGYTNFNYAVKAGRQITAIKAMLDRLTDAHVQNSTVSSANPAAPSGVVLNDVADSGVAVAWRPVAGATDYKVYRAVSGDPNFASLGSVWAPSFGDMRLRHATSYDYRVTVTINGVEGPASVVVTAITRPVAPRCDQPGNCSVR
jgi:poly(3-hydroxybutyrate) depolymerase